jgi:hypothetical protein
MGLVDRDACTEMTNETHFFIEAAITILHKARAENAA